MSLPHGFLDELRGRISLSQVVGRKVMWDSRKSNQGKGDMWAPCPFHQEKSASFHVDDRKGYYYCFGCHAKGDAISFVRETENVGFMEAVEILARESGMPMPARDPQAQKASDRRSELTEVMEQAVQFYRLQIKTAAGAAARSYLEGRGRGSPVWDRFEIGFAPDGWQGLWDHLRAKGVAEELILEAGLAKPSSKGKKPYDTFRNRIQFPIRDARGRCIAFGGRAMDPQDKAKYLNSPQTPLFDKGRSLYNHAPAREAAGKGAPLVVAEGYMDVIALCEAGFTASVAPLGTAITEDQLRLLWRIAPEPVIALDGDAAGLGAAMRLIEVALPLLEAGQSLRFALMPAGKDPDDVLRGGGAPAMQALLDKAEPMVNLLWQRETEGKTFDSPERKAGLDKVLREKIKMIQDPSVRAHYGEAIKDLRFELFRGKGGRKGSQTRRNAAPWAPGGRNLQPWHRDIAATPSARASAYVGDASEHHEDFLREAVILAALVTTPEVCTKFEREVAKMPCLDGEHKALRDAIVAHWSEGSEALRERIIRDLGAAPLEKLLGHAHVRINPAMRHPGKAEFAALTVAEELAKLSARRGLRQELAEAEEDMDGLSDEAVTWRLGQAAEAKNRAEHGAQEDKTEYDTAANGARISREERSAFDALMDKITFAKPQR